MANLLHMKLNGDVLEPSVLVEVTDGGTGFVPMSNSGDIVKRIGESFDTLVQREIVANCRVLTSAFDQLRQDSLPPTKATAEFGLKFSAAGDIYVVKTSAEGSFKITVEWQIPERHNRMNVAHDDCIVRISATEDGEAVGTGFFACPGGFVLTCHHVVKDFPEYWFSWKGRKSPVRVFVNDAWCNEVTDFALFKVRLTSSVSIPTLPLGGTCRAGDLIETKGYQRTDNGFRSYPATGTIGGITIREDGITLMTLERATNVDRGISGAPAFNQRTNVIIGLVSAKDADHNTALIVPLFEVYRCLSATQRDRRRLQPLLDVLPREVTEDHVCETKPTDTELLKLNPLPLPKPYSTFIGRQAEISQVKQMLRAYRLVTITGFGGCGKTRLALQVASELLNEYPDGVGWARLELLPKERPINRGRRVSVESSNVPRTVATALGIQYVPGQSQVETLVDRIGSRRLLLVLDNCEHVFSECVAVIHSILSECPNIKVLATSRQALVGIGANYRVPSLSLPLGGEQSTTDCLADFEAVQLFIERARLNVWDFSVTADNASAVEAICCRLDGIPLAIELAAASVFSDQDVRRISNCLDDVFPGVRPVSTGELPRRATIKATIDWSYGMLSEFERVILRTLSIFSGGWSHEGAMYVCSNTIGTSEDIGQTLTALQAKSLVTVTEGGKRYRMLEIIRLYAMQKLRKSRAASGVRNRHLEWFAMLADNNDDKMMTPGQSAAAELLEVEHANLRFALEWSKQADAASGGHLVGHLWKFWVVHGHLREGREQLKNWLSVQEAMAQADVAARIFVGAGVLAYLDGKFPTAFEMSARGLSLAREVCDDWLTGVSLTILGVYYLVFEADHTKSSEAFREVLALAERTENKWLIGLASVNLGFHVYRTADVSLAVELLERGVVLARSVGDEWLMSLALTKSGICQLLVGNVQEAEARCIESLKISYQRTNLRDPFDILQALEGLILAATVRRHGDRAAQLLGAEEELLRRMGAQVPEFLREMHDTSVANTKAIMGRTQFDDALKIGRSMSPQQAIHYASASE